MNTKKLPPGRAVKNKTRFKVWIEIEQVTGRSGFEEYETIDLPFGCATFESEKEAQAFAVELHSRAEDMKESGFGLNPKLNECDNCGRRVKQIVGCPSGKEVCRRCFNAGHH